MHPVDEAAKKVTMRMKITEVEHGDRTPRREYCDALKSTVNGHIHIERSRIAIEKLVTKLNPYALHKHMMDTIK